MVWNQASQHKCYINFTIVEREIDGNWLGGGSCTSHYSSRDEVLGKSFIDHIYIVLVSAREQTHCAHVTCDSE